MKTSCCHSQKILLEKDSIVCMNMRCENYMRPTSATSSKRSNKVFALFFVVFFFILSFDDFSYNSNTTKSLEQINLRAVRSKPLTPENLRKELDANHIICPEQVFAQIMIESGNLNSFLTKRTNNLLGMRYPTKRKTSAVGLFLPANNLVVNGSQEELKKYRSKNNYAVYETWEASIKDYKLWQQQSFKLTELYLAFLGNYYAEDTLYVSKIKQMTK